MTYGPVTEYHRFNPPRRIEEYVGQPGHQFGLALPPEGYEAIAEAKMHGGPAQFVVRGEWVRSDGVRYLELAVSHDWILANTSYRDHNGRLRWECPSCGRLSGQHSKVCDER